MHTTLGIERLVVAAASVHGTNNNPVLDPIAAERKNLRSIVTADSDITDMELARLRCGGIRIFMQLKCLRQPRTEISS